MIDSVTRLFRKIWAPALLVAYYLGSVSFISAQGDFPINDDIIYGPLVQNFMSSGHFDSVANVSSCFLHVIIGAAVCKLAGFSYFTLHIITLTVGLLGVLLLYATCREIGLNRVGSLLLAFVYSTNPLYTNLCFTYMTDTPALALCNAFFYCAVRAIKRESKVSWFAAAVALICAVFVRQTSAVFSIAVVAVILIPAYLRERRWEILSLFGATAAATFIAEWLLSKQASVCWSAYHAELQQNVLQFMARPLDQLLGLLQNFSELWLYLGLFCAPICLGMVANLFTPIATVKKPILLAGIAVALLLPGLLVYTMQGHPQIPFHYNLWNIPVLGGDRIIHVPSYNLDRATRGVLTGGAIICGSILLWLVLGSLAAVKEERTEPDRAIGLFCCAAVLAAVLELVVLMLVRDYDRYYLLPLAPVLMTVAYAAHYLEIRPAVGWSLAMAILLAGVSTLAQQQFMEATRARWQALDWLEATGVSPADIDGGIEYNSLRKTIGLDSLAYKEVPAKLRGEAPLQWIRWWPVHGEQYIVSSCLVPGYEVVHSQSYWDGLSFELQDILILKRAALSKASRE